MLFLLALAVADVASASYALMLTTASQSSWRRALPAILRYEADDEYGLSWDGRGPLTTELMLADRLLSLARGLTAPYPAS